MWRKLVIVCVGCVGAGACGDDMRDRTEVVHSTATASARPRATLTNGFDVTLRSIIHRASDGREEDVGEEEVFLVPGDRAKFLVTVSNRSDGWAPVNFELCVDHPEELKVVSPYLLDDPWNAQVIDDPCAVRYRDGQWYIVRLGEDVEILAGAMRAEAASGGYITIYFRVEFENGTFDLFEYTVPYRVLPEPDGDL